MRVQSLTLLAFALALPDITLSAQHPEPPPTAEAIMAQVATNQDQAEAERVHYVYIQHAHVVSRKGKTIMCEELTDSRVTPSDTASHVELLKLDGRLLQKGKYLAYTTPLPAEDSGGTQVKNDPDSLSISIGAEDGDRSLVEDMRSNLTNDRSKDGINRNLFPLTSTGQKIYTFHLVGRERLNGREVFHIEFRPKVKEEFGWKGDAFIDTTAYQPVVISTAMARKIPFAVRTLLGTNLPGLGFTVVYAPQPDGVWFPVSFGTEFKLHVLFFFSRQIIMDAQNRDFEKTHVNTRIIGSGTPVEPARSTPVPAAHD